MIVYRCDLCNEIRECSPREIEHVEYDICSECWNALESKLKGKGRPKQEVKAVGQPTPLPPEPTREPEHPFPGAPPKIYAHAEQQVN